MKLLMDYGGLIEEIALCTPHGLRDRDLLRAHAHVLMQLPREIAVTLVCRVEHADVLGRWAARLRSGVRMVPVASINSEGMWTQDPMMVATERGKRRYLRVIPEQTQWLEGACDEYNERLPKLTSFILPGGTPAAALLHQARVVARRAERSVWALVAADGERTNTETARYLNRLSDLLFILARTANPGGDILWEPGAHARSDA